MGSSYNKGQESNTTILLLQVSYKPIAIYKFSSNVRSYYYKKIMKQTGSMIVILMVHCNYIHV
jgi:hypothetical protein